jgi:hypothetical protein
MAKFNTGQSFADGDTVTGAKLNNITSQLNIYTGVISEQTAMVATVSTADQLLIADVDNGDSGAANRITVQKLFSDSLTNGTFASVNLTGTITSNRTVATSATITTGTIPNLTSSTANITLGTIPTLTTGTTTSTAQIVTSGTIATLNSTTPTFLGAITASTNTINVGSGQIYKDASGNVGIGTSSNTANSKLEVYGNSAAAHVGIRANNLAADGYGTLWLSNNSSNDGLIRGGASAASFTNQLALITSGAIPVTIATNNTERLRIASAGQIGIGGENYGTSGQVLTSAGTSSAPSWATNPVGFRNRIINGDMRIDQRNAGSAVTVGTGTAGYTLDRFFAYQNSPSTLVQVSRSTSAPSGFQNSIKWGRNGSGVAGGITVLGQVLETSNSIDAQGGTVTLSFYAKAGANFSAASSQITATLFSGTGTDESVGSMITNAWTGSANPINSGATLTTSWQRFTFTSTTLGATVSQLGLYLSWTPVGVAGADDNVYITGIQLELGSTATDFERRPIGTELDLCYRYLPFFTLSNSTIGIIGQATATTIAYYTLPFQTTARTSPTGITLTTGSLRAFTSVLATAGGTGAFNSAQTTQGQIVVTGATGLVAGNATYLNPSASMTILWTGCEL